MSLRSGLFLEAFFTGQGGGSKSAEQGGANLFWMGQCSGACCGQAKKNMIQSKSVSVNFFAHSIPSAYSAFFALYVSGHNMAFLLQRFSSSVSARSLSNMCNAV